MKYQKLFDPFQKICQKQYFHLNSLKRLNFEAKFVQNWMVRVQLSNIAFGRVVPFLSANPRLARWREGQLKAERIEDVRKFKIYISPAGGRWEIDENGLEKIGRDGSEALAAYSVFQPDWVLMDWVMKKVNGLEATQNIVARYPEAKILIVSSYDAADLRQVAKQAGSCGYVQKDNLLELKQILACGVV